MQEKQDYESVTSLFSKHKLKSIKECAISISSTIEQILIEVPRFSRNKIELSAERTDSLIQKMNEITDAFDQNHIVDSHRLDALRSMGRKYVDVYFFILISVWKSLESLSSARKLLKNGDTEKLRDIEHRMTKIACSSSILLYDCTKKQYYHDRWLSSGTLFFNCNEHAHMESKSESEDSITKCKFSSFSASEASPSSSFLEQCLQSFKNEKDFFKRSKILFGKLWLKVLLILKKGVLSCMELKCINSDEIYPLSTLAYITAVRFADQSIFPICTDPTIFTDLIIRSFKMTAVDSSHDSIEKNDSTEGTVATVLSYRSRIVAAVTSCSLKCVYALVAEHRIEYDGFFTSLLPLLNVSFLDMPFFEEAFSLISAFLLGPMVEDSTSEKFIIRLSSLCVLCASEKQSIPMLDLVEKILNLHPSLRYLLDYSVAENCLEAHKPVTSQSSETLRKNLSILSQSPSERIKIRVRSILFANRAKHTMRSTPGRIDRTISRGNHLFLDRHAASDDLFTRLWSA